MLRTMMARAVAFTGVFASCLAWDFYQGWLALAALYPHEYAALIELDASGLVRLFLLGISLTLASAPSLAGHVGALRYARDRPFGRRPAWALRSAVSGFGAFLLARPILQLSADATRSLELSTAVGFAIAVSVFVFAAALSTLAVERLSSRLGAVPFGLINR